MSQQDFFKAPQPDLFADHKPDQTSHKASPDRVRLKLQRILAEARSAETMPWDEQRLRYLRTVVPQMVNWLPDDEAAQLRFEFDEEVRRLELAAAA
jgi:hypothetical protein